MNTNKNSSNNKTLEKDKKILNLIPSDDSENTPTDARNPGLDFSLDLISGISVNRSGVERRCNSYGYIHPQL